MENRQSITFRSDTDQSEVRSRYGSSLSGRWKMLLAAFVIHFLGNGLTISYGIYIINFVENGTAAWLAFTTQIMYGISFTVAQTWCREVTESWSGTIGYRCMATTGIFIIFIGMIVAAFTTSSLYPLNIGVLGGIGACILFTQVDNILSDCFETHLAMARVLCFIAQASGQILIPQLVLLAIQAYGGPMAILLHSAVMLQTLPVILYLKTDFIPGRPKSISRYSDLSRINSFYNEQYNRNDLQLVELSSKSWSNPSDGGLHNNLKDDDTENVSDDQNGPCLDSPPLSPEEKRKNLFGVEILPEIPEESEFSYSSDSDVDDRKRMRNRFSYNVKRLSVMSDKLDELILKNDSKCEMCNLGHYETGKMNDKTFQNNTATSSKNVETTCYHLSPSYEVSREFNGFQPQNNYRILGYLKRPQRLKRRITYCGYCVNDTFFKPLGISLSFWRFYPALFLKLCSIIVPVGVMSLLPLFAVYLVKVSTREASLLLTLYGLAWLSILVAAPWITSMKKTYVKFIYVGGAFMTLAGLFILADTNSYTFALVSSILLGFGQGATLLSSEDTLREWIGLRKWSKVRGTLEFLSSIGFGLVGLSMAFTLTSLKGVKHCFELLTLLQAVITFMWFLISISNIYFRKHRQSYDIGALPC